MYVRYEALVNAIIRPPRAEYEIRDLGPSIFTISGRRFCRKDFSIKNERNLKLECSWWRPETPCAPTLPCVICMHGNSSCRLETMSNLESLLTGGMTVFGFDFSGSGLSEGSHVSLGYHEQEDLKRVIAYLRDSGTVSTIGLWGRSMGAATALLYAHRDPSIAGMVLDSSFADMYQLCREMVRFAEKQGWYVPGVLMAGAIRMLRNSVKKRVKGFDIYDLKPIANVDQAFVPALFVHGKSDDFILPSHTEKLHQKYAGEAEMMMVEGDHNSPRPKFMRDSAAIFLKTALRVPDAYAISAESFNGNDRFGLGHEIGGGDVILRDQDDARLQEAIRLSLEESRNSSEAVTKSTDHDNDAIRSPCPGLPKPDDIRPVRSSSPAEFARKVIAISKKSSSSPPPPEPPNSADTSSPTESKTISDE